jgi:hypothetical protein
MLASTILRYILSQKANFYLKAHSVPRIPMTSKVRRGYSSSSAPYPNNPSGSFGYFMEKVKINEN